MAEKNICTVSIPSISQSSIRKFSKTDVFLRNHSEIEVKRLKNGDIERIIFPNETEYYSYLIFLGKLIHLDYTLNGVNIHF